MVTTLPEIHALSLNRPSAHFISLQTFILQTETIPSHNRHSAETRLYTMKTRHTPTFPTTLHTLPATCGSSQERKESAKARNRYMNHDSTQKKNAKLYLLCLCLPKTFNAFSLRRCLISLFPLMSFNIRGKVSGFPASSLLSSCYMQERFLFSAVCLVGVLGISV